MGDMSREPSMEEILSSIRRVIARDDSRRAGGLSPMDLSSAPDTTDLGEEEEDGFDEDVLELTQMPSEEPALQTVAVASAPEPVLSTPQPEPIARTPPSASPAIPQAEPDAPALAAATAAPLVSPVSAAASRQSLDTLAALLAGETATETPAAEAPPAVTVNELAEAALRPMLKAWLDANLPTMVEKLVAREIARITGNRL